jgi:hypothetical protein
MFFQNLSWRPFLEGPGADLASTGRFWYHFRFSGFPKRRHLDTISAQKNETGPVVSSILLSPFCPCRAPHPKWYQDAPRPDFHRFGIDSGTDFVWIFHDFG